MAKLIVHDLRLGGHTPTRLADASLHVLEDTSVTQVLHWINIKAQALGKIDAMYILAHGYENEAGIGGYGVQLGKEGLQIKNVNLWGSIAGKVGVIYLMACGAAAVGSTSEDGEGDGMRLCATLAVYANAWVVASTAPQKYFRGFLPFWGIDNINFGEWEGTVFWFNPYGEIKYVEQHDQ